MSAARPRSSRAPPPSARSVSNGRYRPALASETTTVVCPLPPLNEPVAGSSTYFVRACVRWVSTTVNDRVSRSVLAVAPLPVVPVIVMVCGWLTIAMAFAVVPSRTAGHPAPAASPNR